MLSGFQVKNFKAFADTSQISVKPLSILSGINSAGKSSIIQSLLLLKQTIGSERALNLQGELMPSKVNFDELVNNKPKLDNAELAYILKFHYKRVDNESMKSLFKLIDQVGQQLEITLPERETSHLNLVLTIKFEHGSYGFIGRSTERVTQLTIDFKYGEVTLGKINILNSGEGGYKVEIAPESPQRLVNEARLAIDGLTNFLPSSLIFEGETNGWQLSFGKMFRQLMSLIRNDLSDNLNYLGASRTAGRQTYSYDSSSFVVSKDGGNFASVFWNLRHQKVKYAFNNDCVKKSLSEWTYDILSQVGLKQKVNIRKIKGGVELIIVELDTLNARDVKVTLPDVGQGYNQILPLIIQGLLTPENGLVIFEQPEIHLHPNIQSQLIQFFIGLARAGRNVFIETHSSHLIDQLQLQIIKDHSNWIQENSQLLFVHPPHKYSASAKTQIIEIDPYGAIEYPPNFLPDTSLLYDEMIRASFEKRRAEKAS